MASLTAAYPDGIDQTTDVLLRDTYGRRAGPDQLDLSSSINTPRSWLKGIAMKVFNHGIHIVLDVLTCGLWLPIHLLLWILAPTIPVGAGASSAAVASANTTIVFGGPAHYPPMMNDGGHSGAGTNGHYPQAPAAQVPTVSAAATPPGWAIAIARERLPQDAPWEAVASVAWEVAQIGKDAPEVSPGYPQPRQLPNS